MASIHTDTFSSHYCKPRQAAHKPTNTSGSCYQQFLCAQNDSNAQMGCVVSHRYTSPVSTARPRDHISASCCTTPAKQPPRGRDKQSKGILDDTQAITNSGISYDCKPVCVFQWLFCNWGQAIWKIQPDLLCKAQGDPWQHYLLSKQWIQLLQYELC